MTQRITLSAPSIPPSDDTPPPSLTAMRSDYPGAPIHAIGAGGWPLCGARVLDHWVPATAEDLAAGRVCRRCETAYQRGVQRPPNQPRRTRVEVRAARAAVRVPDACTISAPWDADTHVSAVDGATLCGLPVSGLWRPDAGLATCAGCLAVLRLVGNGAAAVGRKDGAA